MTINNALIKHYLKNVMFINGNSYAGKSTMTKMLADKYDLIFCGENYKCIPDGIVNPDEYPNICFTKPMKDWQKFLNRTPEQYDNWIRETSREKVEFEITYLMSISRSQKVIVDTNIPLDILREVADYNQVAIMLMTPELSTEYFFDRNDDKPFIKEQIMKAENPESTMENYLAGIELINRRQYYEDFANSGFFTLERKDVATDTKLETLEILAKHFGLEL